MIRRIPGEGNDPGQRLIAQGPASQRIGIQNEPARPRSRSLAPTTALQRCPISFHGSNSLIGRQRPGASFSQSDAQRLPRPLVEFSPQIGANYESEDVPQPSRDGKSLRNGRVCQGFGQSDKTLSGFPLTVTPPRRLVKGVDGHWLPETNRRGLDGRSTVRVCVRCGVRAAPRRRTCQPGTADRRGGRSGIQRFG